MISARRSPRSPARLAERVDKNKVAARLAARGARRRETREATRKDILAESASAPLSADAAVLAALDALPEDAIIANDSAATFGRVQDLMTTEPGRYFFARGGVLGCSMPAAVGAALATKGWVASFVGDGGAMYSPQALWSAAHYKARTIFVVFNNRRYGVLQNVAKSLGYANAKAGRFVGMDVVDPAIDFQALAASMGVPAELANDRDAIGAAIERALKREGPSLIEDSDPLSSPGARLMQIARVDEFRHVPVVADRQQAERQSRGHGEDHHRVMRKSHSEAADIKGTGHDGHAGIELAAKQQGYVVAQHVAQDPADAAGDHAGHDDDKKRQVEIERHVAADHREQGEADRIENEKDVS